jgi:hypothetical protein
VSYQNELIDVPLKIFISYIYIYIYIWDCILRSWIGVSKRLKALKNSIYIFTFGVNYWGMLNVVTLIWVCNQLLEWVTKCPFQNEGKAKAFKLELD